MIQHLRIRRYRPDGLFQEVDGEYLAVLRRAKE
jgi:hypothetical protein